MKSRPDAKQAHVNLGIVQQESGDLKGARESYERALQIAPDLADVIYNLACVLEQQGQAEESERLYSKLLSRNPEWEDAWFRLDYLRLQRGDFRGAVEGFQSCVRKRTPWPEAQLNLGLSQWKLGDQDGAAKSFQAVLESEPGSVDALRGLAAMAIERGGGFGEIGGRLSGAQLVACLQAARGVTDVHRNDLAGFYGRQIHLGVGVQQAAIVQAKQARISTVFDPGAPKRTASQQHAAAFHTRAAQHRRELLKWEVEFHAHVHSNRCRIKPHVDVACAAGVFIGR